MPFLNNFVGIVILFVSLNLFLVILGYIGRRFPEAFGSGTNTMNPMSSLILVEESAGENLNPTPPFFVHAENQHSF